MTDREVDILRNALSRGMIYWRSYESAPALKVVKIDTELPATKIHFNREADPLAFFETPSAQFINLRNCELKEFVLAQPIQ
jgi:hypothetical protein